MNGLKLALLLVGLLIATNIAGWDDIEWVFYSGLALLLIAYIWSRGSLVGVGLSRTLDSDRIIAGDEVRERFRAVNRSRIPKTWITFHDRSTLPGHATSSAISIKGRSETAWVNRTKADQRGRYRLGPIELRSGDPFGLFSQKKVLDLTHELLVYPRLVPLPGPSRRGGELSGGTRLAPGRSANSPVIRSLRQYVVGDPMNQIAWRSSARHGSLLVKELEPDPVTDEWILLDLAPIERREGRKAVEYAVSLAASFALEWLNAARDVGLLVNRAIPAIVDADAGDRQRFRILETLAIVEPYGEANPASLIARFASRFSRSTSLVVISTGSGRDLVRPLQHLAQRGVPMLVFAVGEADGNLAAEGWSDIESSGIAVTRLDPNGEVVAAIARRHDTSTSAAVS
ncbi:MAG TPA: DUF58 domain-containing protein [Thermomicrobiales bacterium]|nr:DUF58 domain-containing protein [Thermomicrobiales bacterium]